MCTTTQCPTFTSNKHMKQYLCASSFETIKATIQPRLWEFGKMVNMYIVNGGPSTYVDLTFCMIVLQLSTISPMHNMWS